jgi:hypothetical protein
MDDDTAKGFMAVVMNEDKINQDVLDDPSKTSADIGYQIADKRSEAMGLEINAAVKIFLIGYLCDRAGTVVFYLSYLRLVQQETGRPINMTEFAQIFPMGYPNEETLSLLWSAQKLNGATRKALAVKYGFPDNHFNDNLLDNLSWFKTKGEPGNEMS